MLSGEPDQAVSGEGVWRAQYEVVTEFEAGALARASYLRV